jgi:hypothetical protein
MRCPTSLDEGSIPAFATPSILFSFTETVNFKWRRIGLVTFMVHFNSSPSSTRLSKLTISSPCFAVPTIWPFSEVKLNRTESFPTGVEIVVSYIPWKSIFSIIWIEEYSVATGGLTFRISLSIFPSAFQTVPLQSYSNNCFTACAINMLNKREA